MEESTTSLFSKALTLSESSRSLRVEPTMNDSDIMTVLPLGQHRVLLDVHRATTESPINRRMSFSSAQFLLLNILHLENNTQNKLRGKT